MENENYKGVSPTVEDQLQNNSQQPPEDEMDEEASAKERLTSQDPTKVVFLSANSEYTRKNGDAKVDIENVQRSVGMGKEELMKYANEPFWVRLRMTMFVLFWVVWLAMLIGSVAIIVMIPGCPASPRLNWWQKTVVYQVVVGSFKDSDGNNKGDLQGLASKLDYLSDLKVDTLLLSPIFESPGSDIPNEVTNFTDVARHHGTLNDFKNLTAMADSKGMKIILEFDPNHSSDKHPWFIKSANSQDPFTDFYIWADSKSGSPNPQEPPNNWVSVSGGSAWSWNPQRKKFYLHQFHASQPDLNLRNPALRQELKNILRFWLDEGVDGFKLKDTDYLFEDQALTDEPGASQRGSEYESLNHTHTKGHSENLELLREWREILMNYTDATDKNQRILLTDSSEMTFKSYFGKSDDPLVDIPYNMQLTTLTKDSTPTDLLNAFQQSFNETPSGFWPNWVLGTSSQRRLLSRVGPALLDGIHMVTLLNKGTPIVFFGDELGMSGGMLLKEGQDPEEAETPMQWDNTSTPGESNDLGAVSSTARVNVQSEMKHTHSHLSIFKKLVELREKPCIGFGILDFPKVDNQIFSMLRVKKGTPGFLVVINFGSNSTVVDFTGSSVYLPEIANVELATDVPGYLKDTGHPKIKLAEVSLGPHQSAVLTFVPKDK